MRKIYLLGFVLLLSFCPLSAQSSLRVLEGMGTRLYDINDSGNALHPAGYYDFATNTSTSIEAGAQSTAKINNNNDVAGVMPFTAEDGSNIDESAYKKNGVWNGIGYFPGDVPESGWFAGASAISENSKYVTGLISIGVSGALPFIFDTETSTLTKLTGDNLYEAGRGYGVNDSGIVAAWIDRDDIFNTGTFRVPAYFDAGGMVHYIDFDTPEYGEANDINNAGQVVGYKSNKAFIYDINTGVYQSFTAPDGSAAVFTSISDNGIAIGYSDDLGTREVIIYHPSLGDAPVFLKDLLIAEGVTITTFDGKLGTGMGISPNGKFICGFDNAAPVFFAAGWVAYLDIEIGTEEGCLDAPYGQYPTGEAFVPECQGEPETITEAAWTGEYSLVTVTAGTEYIFSSSVETDFVTISNADGTVVLAAGATPLTWTANAGQDVRFYLHLDAECNSINEGLRSRIVQCGEFTPPTDYCMPELDCNDGDLITNVTFAGINNDSDCSPNGYGDYTEMQAEVEAGETYSMSVTVGAGWDYEATMVWIDFNNDFIFDPATEYFFIGSDPGTTNTADITIPAGTPDGEYRLRVRVGAVNPDLNDLSLLACDEETVYGETEDYTLVVGELGVSDMDAFDFSYYPNPVKDELNISAKKVVQSVSVYNLAGQQVSAQKFNATNGKVSTSSLAPGVYVFKAVLEGGQVETFKVVKK